jgi:hypothetical protein
MHQVPCAVAPNLLPDSAVVLLYELFPVRPYLETSIVHCGIGERPQWIALISDEVRRRNIRSLAIDVDLPTADRALDAFVD